MKTGEYNTVNVINIWDTKFYITTHFLADVKKSLFTYYTFNNDHFIVRTYLEKKKTLVPFTEPNLNVFVMN